MRLRKEMIDRISDKIVMRLLDKELISPDMKIDVVRTRISNIIEEDLLVEDKLNEEVKEIFPNKNIEILSSDTLKNKVKNAQFASKIENREIDILVGTQLISKGFHFPKLNCIVVVDPDLNSHGFDLRNSEKNVQLYVD